MKHLIPALLTAACVCTPVIAADSPVPAEILAQIPEAYHDKIQPVDEIYARVQETDIICFGPEAEQGICEGLAEIVNVEGGAITSDLITLVEPQPGVYVKSFLTAVSYEKNGMSCGSFIELMTSSTNYVSQTISPTIEDGDQLMAIPKEALVQKLKAMFGDVEEACSAEAKISDGVYRSFSFWDGVLAPEDMQDGIWALLQKSEFKRMSPKPLP